MSDVVHLVVRDDGTYDYSYATGYNDVIVTSMLRQVADQIESGCAISNPSELP